jgi:glycosyltransferase involved in cell wall biosynthesis
VTTPPRVSVVVPVYNSGRYLSDALASVASQTFRDYELVLVDDGSTDAATIARCDAAAREPAVRLVRTANRGPSHARNTGIEAARAPYVLPLDSDDWLAPTFLARTVAVLDAEPGVDVVHTWVALVGRHHGVWETGPFAVPEMLSRCAIHVSSLYRRRVWELAGGYDARFVQSCEDWDFWLSALEHGVVGCGIPEVLAYYRRTPSSREIGSRAPGVSTELMRNLVAKHRALYVAHVDEAFAAIYERLAAAGVTLERIYHHPVMRAYVWVAQHLWRRPGRARG